MFPASIGYHNRDIRGIQMMKTSKAFWESPVFAGDEDRTDTARTLNHMIWVILIILGIGFILTPFIFVRITISLFIILVLSAILLISRTLMLRGQVQLASVIVLSGIWITFTGIIVLGGGLANINVVFFISLIVLAGMLMGRRAAIFFSILSVATGLVLVLIENLHSLPPPYFASTPLGNWAELSFAIILTNTVIHLALRNREDALKDARKQLAERFLAEEALRENEELFTKLIAALPDIMVRMDLNGQILFVNDFGLSMSGYTRADLIGHNMLAVIAPEDREKAVRNTILMLEKRLGPQEYHLILKDGGRVLFEVNGDVLRNEDGSPYGIVQICRDITDRKRAEEALRESEEKYRLLFEYSPLGHLYCDEKGIIVACNDNFVQIIGSSREALIGLNMLNLSDKNIVSAVQKALNGSIGIYEDVYHSVTARKMTPVRALFAPINIGDGRIIGGVGIIEDITERKREEEEKRMVEGRLHTLVQTIPDLIWLKDADGVFLACNPMFERLFGAKESDIVGKTDYDFVDKEMADFFREHDRKSMAAGKPSSNEEWLTFADNGYRGLFDTIKTPMYDAEGKLIGVLGIARDITERKRVEEERRESQRRLSDIIEFLPDATLVIDKDGKVIAWNRAIEAMTGVKKEDMIDKAYKEYALPFYGDRRPILIDLALHPDAEIEKQYTAIQRVGDILFGESFTPNLPPGNIHLSATASVLRDSKGEIIAAIECIRDNTERKRLEERLNRAEKMEGLGRLAGGVAHDLNNVLGVLVGYSELLLQKLAEDSPLRKYADTILRSSMKGAAIIQDLLTLARRGVSVSDIVDFNMVIFAYLKSPEFETLKSYHRDVKIWTDLEDGLLNIKGSPIHLEKTLMNLVSNAAEAISGQGEVMIRTENRYLDQPIWGYDDVQEGDYMLLTVSDTGRGIASQDVGKIFEPFYTKKVMGRSGTGLGLAVVWGTVKDHNGYIDVESEEGKGTTFKLYFPITREELTKVKDAVSSSIYMGRGESILVVDDVKEQRELAMSILGWLGYRVDALSSGEEAIEYLKSKNVDLVVLDMIMEPGIDGLETYKRILEIKPKQKAIIVSGFSETDRVKKALEIGAGSFVRKPYIMEKLGLAIIGALGKT